MKEIALTRGKVALVDDQDYEWLSQWKWSWIPEASGTGYAKRSIKRGGQWTTIRMHRVILGASSDTEGDHCNGNGLDNQRANLRLCTRSQNTMNSKKHDGCSSRYKGVHWDSDRQKWRVQIGSRDNRQRLGRFDDENEAARVYNAKARELFGEFAYLNIIG